MVHPDMATVLCFLTTDAPAEPRWLQQVLKRRRRRLAQHARRRHGHLDQRHDAAAGERRRGRRADCAPATRRRNAFAAALQALAIELTRDLARDGEGARTLIEVTVTGAHDAREARAGGAHRGFVSAGEDHDHRPRSEPRPRADGARPLRRAHRRRAQSRLDRRSVRVRARRGRPRSTTPKSRARWTAPRSRSAPTSGLGRRTATAWGCDLTGRVRPHQRRLHDLEITPRARSGCGLDRDLALRLRRVAWATAG